MKNNKRKRLMRKPNSLRMRPIRLKLKAKMRKRLLRKQKKRLNTLLRR